MNPQSDRPILIAAAFLSVMLLMIFIGDALPPLLQTILYGISCIGVIGCLILKNILSGSQAAKSRILFGIGILAMILIVVAIILLDNRFVSGDPLLLGLEPSTALLVFGLTFFPFYFVILWVAHFKKAIVNPDKEDQLEQLQAGKENHSDG